MKLINKRATVQSPFEEQWSIMTAKLRRDKELLSPKSDSCNYFRLSTFSPVIVSIEIKYKMKRCGSSGAVITNIPWAPQDVGVTRCSVGPIFI